MRPLFPILYLAILCAGCSQSPVHYDSQATRSNIVAALPTGWSVIPPDGQQQGFTTAYFSHPHAESFILLGPQPNYIDWIPHQGPPHREYLAKECLYVWIVPGDFRPQLPPFFEDAPKPYRIFVSRDVRVYGYVSHHIADTNRMNQIIKEATMVSSPEIRLSWTSWKKDIAASASK